MLIKLILSIGFTLYLASWLELVRTCGRVLLLVFSFYCLQQ